MDAELLEKYGEEYLKEYKKTTQYQLDELEKALKECWDSTGLEQYYHKFAEWSLSVVNSILYIKCSKCSYAYAFNEYTITRDIAAMMI